MSDIKMINNFVMISQDGNKIILYYKIKNDDNSLR
jgi:hypothetical protein